MTLEDAQTCPIGGSNKSDIKTQTRRRKTFYGTSNIWYRIKCYCGICGPWEPSIDLAIEYWNRIRIK